RRPLSGPDSLLIRAQVDAQTPISRSRLMAGYLLFGFLMSDTSETDAAEPSAPAKKARRSAMWRSVGWLFSPKHFYFKLLSGTAVGIVVITFLAGLFLFVTFQNHHQATLRAHTLAVLQLSRTIESDLAAAESIHRGYLLTGDTAFIKAFDSRKELIKSRTEELTLLILDTQNKRKRVMKVQEIVQKWLDTVALPQLAQQRGRAPTPVHDLGTITSASLGNALL